MQAALGSGDYEKVELYISARKLKNLDTFSKSDPQVRLFVQNKGQWVAAGKTEVIKDNLNPNFSTTFTLDFIFEIQQPLRFQVVDVDGPTSFDEIGVVECPLGKIMGAKNQTLILDIIGKGGKCNGKLVIRGEKIGTSRNILYMQWAGVKLMNTDGWFDKSDPLLRFMKWRDGGEWLKVHETEVIMNNLNPIWKAFEIRDDKLCGSDDSKPFKIECWDWEKSGKYQFIGEVQLTLSDLKNGKKEFDLSNSKKKKKTGTLKLLSFSFIERPSFIDYIKGGDQLNVVVAIDFTGSNGHPNSSSSLHARLRNGLNQYQKAISAVCNILLNYDWDQQIPVFGFGGKPRFPTLSSNVVSHCFPCTGNLQNPNVLGLQGIMDVYSYALQNVELSGPTYFGPIIAEAMKLAQIHKQSETGVYTILLILTDGEIHDMKETVDLIVKAAQLPLSIIIVGVGNADFGNMETLDGDQGLYDSNGQRAQRDLVQFVPFRNFDGDMVMLAKAVLAEVPDQLVDYNRIVGRKPRPAQQIDMTRVGMETSTLPQNQILVNLGNQLVQNYTQYQQQQQQFVPIQNPLLVNIGNQLIDQNAYYQQPQGQYQQQQMMNNQQNINLNAFGNFNQGQNF